MDLLLIIANIFVIFVLVNFIYSKNKSFKDELKVFRESHDELEDISQIGTWYRNLGTNKLHWSPLTYRIFGLNPLKKRITSIDFYKAVLPEYRELIKAISTRTENSNTPYDITYKIRRADGQIRTLHNNAKIYFDTAGKPFKMLGTCKDITDEKNGLVEKLHQAKLATLGEISAGVAHEINNPLTILFATSKKLSKLTSLDDQHERLYNIQKKSLERITKIVTGLRTYSRIDELDYQNFEINKSVIESSVLVENIFKNDGVDIVLELHSDDVITHGSTGGFQQVILNLLYNSKDAFIKNHQKNVIKIQTQKIKDKIQILVSDNGPGISDQHVSKIFESFYTTKPAGKGTGLGLSLSKSILEDMNGNLHLLKTNHMGTTFSIEFPVVN
ncbi:hypothetical protein A9Q84_15700 [Halobacteriovorax marinus]|uniref:histidine kinase n=1 Tax=Halobacteriovorax marinus TaxID=97084 RepID=A0A1Y5F3X3_9BACT|nr:hypothetical protein A9Q84_15700 [Halobacteriovorax marinus]